MDKSCHNGPAYGSGEMLTLHSGAVLYRCVGMLLGRKQLRCCTPWTGIATHMLVSSVRGFSDDTAPQNDNASIRPNPQFVNRNPRNLERLCLKPKDYGWGMEWDGYAKSQSSNIPRRNYYYRLNLWETGSYTYAEVQHYSGDTVIEASTRESCIRKHLYSPRDVTAAANLGRIIAERCLRAGISCVSFRFPDGLRGDSEKIEHFQAGAEERGLFLEEPDNRRLDYVKPHEVLIGPRPPELD